MRAMIKEAKSILETLQERDDRFVVGILPPDITDIAMIDEDTLEACDYFVGIRTYE